MDVTAAIAVSGVTAAGFRLAVSAPEPPDARAGAAGESQSGTPGGGHGTGRAVTLKPAALLAGGPLAAAPGIQDPALAPEIEPLQEVSLKASQAYAFSATAGGDPEGRPPIFNLIG